MSGATLKVLVYAEDEEEAKGIADSTFNKLCEYEGGYFDYIQDREHCEVYRADTPEGKRIIDEGLDFAKSEYLSYLKKVREALEIFSDEELFTMTASPEARIALGIKQDKYMVSDLQSGMIDFYLGKLAREMGPHVQLYDEYARPIADPKEFKSIMDNENKEEGTLFVVCASAHY